MKKKVLILTLLLVLVLFGVSANNLDQSTKGDMSLGVEVGSTEGLSFRYQFDDKLSATMGLGFKVWPIRGVGAFGGVDYIVLDPTYFTKEDTSWWFLLTVGGRLNLGTRFGYYSSVGLSFGITAPVTFIVQTSEAPVEFGLLLGPGYEGDYYNSSYGSNFNNYFSIDSGIFVRYRF